MIAADKGAAVRITASPDFPLKYPYQYTLQRQDAFLAKIAPGTIGPSIALAGALSAANYGSVVVPGGLVSIFGKALALTPASAGAPPLPSQLSDVQVTVNGVAAPLLYVSQT